MTLFPLKSKPNRNKPQLRSCTGNQLFLLLIFIWVIPLCSAGANILTPPHTVNCPPYYSLDDGDTLDCTCKGDCASGIQEHITWPGYSDTARLLRTKIERSQDGTIFTCRMLCGGQAANVSYTLRMNYILTPPHTVNCPSYVDVGATLDCTCRGRCYTGIQEHITWPGYSDTARLIRTKIERSQDGTIFTCRMLCRSQAANVSYTLPVASVQTPPSTADCPRYVDEGGSLACTCTGKCIASIEAKFKWPGFSTGPSLSRPSVKRSDNGTIFNCTLVCGHHEATASYVLLVAYGPSGNTMELQGPTPPIITDGTRQLTLTCRDRESYPEPAFTWLNVACDGGNKNKTCTFKPTALDDKKTVTCKAASVAGKAERTGTKVFVLDLKYPPTKAPVISGFTPGTVLKSGVKLSCTAGGGKPPAEEVLFKCFPSGHEDQPDTRTNGGIVSTLTINTSRIIQPQTLCTCRVYWHTDPTLCLQVCRTDIVIETEYRATVTQMAVTGPWDELSGTQPLTLGQQATVSCDGIGRPLPNVTIQLENASGRRTVAGNSSRVSGYTREIVYSIEPLTCRDAGTYTCIASNQLGQPHVKSLGLNIPPSFDPELSLRNNAENPVMMMGRLGTDVPLEAYPLPETFTYFYYGTDTTGEGKKIPPDAFLEKISDVEDGCRATLSIVPSNKPLNSKGVYKVNISNGFGSAALFFYLGDDLAPSMSKASSGLISGMTAGVLSGMAFIVSVQFQHFALYG